MPNKIVLKIPLSVLERIENRLHRYDVAEMVFLELDGSTFNLLRSISKSVGVASIHGATFVDLQGVK